MLRLPQPSVTMGPSMNNGAAVSRSILSWPLRLTDSRSSLQKPTSAIVGFQLSRGCIGTCSMKAIAVWYLLCKENRKLLRLAEQKSSSTPSPPFALPPLGSLPEPLYTKRRINTNTHRGGTGTHTCNVSLDTVHAQWSWNDFSFFWNTWQVKCLEAG